MAKKVKITYVYLIGMILAAVGFCCPLFNYKKNVFANLAGNTAPNGFKFIDFDNFNFVTIAALLVLVGACAGIIFCFLKGNWRMLQLIALAVSIVGGIILVINLSGNGNGNQFQTAFAKAAGKDLWKHAYIGVYMILAGWIVAIVGWITNR